MITWVKRNAIGLLLIVAIVTATLVTLDQRQRDTKKTRQILVTQIEASRIGCRSNARRTAINAAGWEILATRVENRDAPGDRTSASQYRAISLGLIREVPAPEGLESKRLRELAEVKLVKIPPTSRLVAKLTPHSRKLQTLGCKRRFPLPEK